MTFNILSDITVISDITDITVFLCLNLFSENKSLVDFLVYNKDWSVANINDFYSALLVCLGPTN